MNSCSTFATFTFTLATTTAFINAVSIVSVFTNPNTEALQASDPSLVDNHIQETLQEFGPE
jgi:hypothetical protein